MHANDLNDQRYDYDVIVIGQARPGSPPRRPSPDRGCACSWSKSIGASRSFPRPRASVRAAWRSCAAGGGIRDPPSVAAQSIGDGDLADPCRTPSGCRSWSTTDDVVSAVTPTRLAICGQDQLEQVLHDHLRARGGTIRFRTEMVGFSQTDDAVCVTLRPRDGQATTRSRLSIWSAPTVDVVRCGRGSASNSSRWARKAITLRSCSMPICRPCFRTRPTS